MPVVGDEMHQAAYKFVERETAGVDFREKKVLEIGSCDVNGSVRGLFEGAEYCGVDLREGPGVDVVCDIRRFGGSDFDVVVCTEVLEHDPQPEEIISKAWELLKPGGILILTAAGPGRTAHTVNGLWWDGSEHYANIDPEQLKGWLSGWAKVEVVFNEPNCDVYARAVR